MKNKQEALELSGLIENLSHELRTPLNAILGYSELLKKSDNLTEEEQQHLDKIEASGGRLLDVINDIVEISSIDQGHVEVDVKPFDMCVLADDIRTKFGAMARMKGIDLIVTTQGSLIVETDPDKVRIAIYSLISNAIKFTTSGSVQVEMEVTGGKEKAGQELIVTITDSGRGISEEDLPNIYKPFWRKAENDEKGTGLGLTICEKLVSLLDGRIHVLSFYDEGSRFRLQVPVGAVASSGGEEKEKPVSAFEKPSKEHMDRTPKVLVVDDMQVNRTLARIMLEHQNCQVIEAENGKEALEKYDHSSPDLVLMDISMPEMDGVTAMEKLRTAHSNSVKQLPIIAVTAGGHTGTRKELLKKGFTEYIQKPFKEKELMEKIQDFLPVVCSRSRKKSGDLYRTAVRE